MALPVPRVPAGPCAVWACAMTTLLQDGVAWLQGQLKDSSGVTVTFYRGTESVVITATPVQKDYTVPLETGGWMNVTSRDYYFAAADVIISGSVVKPRQGDRIIETIGGVEYSYTILSFGSMPACEWRDQDGVGLIVHSKLTKTTT